MSYHIYPIYRILFLWGKLVCGLLRSPKLFVIFVITKSCNLSLLWVCVHLSFVEVIEIVI